MRIKSSFLLLLISFAVFLGSCSTSSYAYKKTIQSWVDAPSVELEAAWGRPQEIIHDTQAEKTIWVYHVSVQGILTVFRRKKVYQSTEVYTCKTFFLVHPVSDRVRKANSNGNACVTSINTPAKVPLNEAK